MDLPDQTYLVPFYRSLESLKGMKVIPPFSLATGNGVIASEGGLTFFPKSTQGSQQYIR